MDPITGKSTDDELDSSLPKSGGHWAMADDDTGSSGGGGGHWAMAGDDTGGGGGHWAMSGDDPETNIGDGGGHWAKTGGYDDDTPKKGGHWAKAPSVEAGEDGEDDDSTFKFVPKSKRK